MILMTISDWTDRNLSGVYVCVCVYICRGVDGCGRGRKERREGKEYFLSQKRHYLSPSTKLCSTSLTPLSKRPLLRPQPLPCSPQSCKRNALPDAINQGEVGQEKYLQICQQKGDKRGKVRVEARNTTQTTQRHNKENMKEMEAKRETHHLA